MPLHFLLLLFLLSFASIVKFLFYCCICECAAKMAFECRIDWKTHRITFNVMYAIVSCHLSFWSIELFFNDSDIKFNNNEQIEIHFFLFIKHTQRSCSIKKKKGKNDLCNKKKGKFMFESMRALPLNARARAQFLFSFFLSLFEGVIKAL